MKGGDGAGVITGIGNCTNGDRGSNQERDYKADIGEMLDCNRCSKA